MSGFAHLGWNAGLGLTTGERRQDYSINTSSEGRQNKNKTVCETKRKWNDDLNIINTKNHKIELFSSTTFKFGLKCVCTDALICCYHVCIVCMLCCWVVHNIVQQPKTQLDWNWEPEMYFQMYFLSTEAAGRNQTNSPSTSLLLFSSVSGVSAPSDSSPD